MGLLRDIRDLQRAGTELARDFDPAAQMRAATAQLQHMTGQAGLTTSASAVTATATVTALRETGTTIDAQPVIAVDVLVLPIAGAPFPATVSIQGVARLVGLAPGATVAVRYEPASPTVVALA